MGNMRNTRSKSHKISRGGERSQIGAQSCTSSSSCNSILSRSMMSMIAVDVGAGGGGVGRGGIKHYLH